MIISEPLLIGLYTDLLIFFATFATKGLDLHSVYEILHLSEIL